VVVVVVVVVGVVVAVAEARRVELMVRRAAAGRDGGIDRGRAGRSSKMERRMSLLMVVGRVADCAPLCA